MSTIQQLNSDLCTGCGACQQSCPHAAITMQADREGFLHPCIQPEACVDCGLCVRVCPVLEPTHLSHTPTAYAAQAKDEAVRNQSSSGGVFTLLAEKVLEQGGAVFGAAFDESFDVVHTVAHNGEELAQLRGSKYVQSRLCDSFQQAKDYLDSGKLVLFSGTPCQIEGLQKFLRKPYDNLITQDMICHGVPSPMVWQKYIQSAEARYRSKLCRVFFRHKVSGWRHYRLRLQFGNGKIYTATQSEDPFMRSFLQDLTLRPSCYQCAFKKVSRVSDFTLADFWGIQHCLPEMDDDKGTSLVICHTDKAKKLLDSIQDRLVCIPADLQEAIRHNSAMCQSVQMPSDRGAFMQDILHAPFKKVVRQYCPKPSLPMRVIRKLKRLVRGV